ncbi:helix-turn-helix domain-containing protein [Fimbriiglobus ruber]|uniref:HTH cro/C1-type domain-containing protein n=1 Tax=Fimbriiglobus ruber TaxID=1908690 RepID=A0A225E6P7_9BACT|nr:helix-turn-helix transcriptional regulator [Fimbriiglobus ruber]OWK46478.1 hypothetical protein FRUB_00177 [Fimbriiglobus ruber]
MSRPLVVIWGRLLKEYREQKGWSQAELEAKSRVARRTIQQIEKSTGAHKAAPQTLRDLANALGLSQSDLQPDTSQSVPFYGDTPTSDSRCLGREEELRALNTAWGDRRINILVVHAAGGDGKSTLISNSVVQNWRWS